MPDPTDAPVPPVTYKDLALIHERLEHMDGRLERGDARFATIESQQLAQTKAIEENTTVTLEVRDLLTTFKAGMRIAGWIGTGARWVRNIVLAALAVLGLYHAVKTGQAINPTDLGK